MQQASLRSHVHERAVAIVLKQVGRGSLAGGKTLKPRAIHEENIQPTVVAVIVECDATTGRLQQILVFVLTAEDRLYIQPRLASYVDEINAEASGRGCRSLFC